MRVSHGPSAARSRYPIASQSCSSSSRNGRDHHVRLVQGRSWLKSTPRHEERRPIATLKWRPARPRLMPSFSFHPRAACRGSSASDSKTGLPLFHATQNSFNISRLHTSEITLSASWKSVVARFLGSRLLGLPSGPSFSRNNCPAYGA